MPVWSTENDSQSRPESMPLICTGGSARRGTALKRSSEAGGAPSGLGGESTDTRDQCCGPSAAIGTSHAAGSFHQIAAGSVHARPAGDTSGATAGSYRSGDTTSLSATR